MSCIEMVTALALSSAAMVQATPGAKTPITLAEVRDGVATRDALLRNISLRATYNGRTRKNWMRSAPFIDMVQIIDAVVDISQGLTTDVSAKLDVTETPDPEIVPRLASGTKYIHYLCNHQDQRSVALETATNGKTVLGFISAGNGLRWLVPIPELLSTNYWSPTRILANEDYSASIEPEALGTDGTIVKVNWIFRKVRTSLGRFRGTYWIDPTRGFAVIHSETYRQPMPEAPWKLVSRVDTRGWKQVEDIWVPSSASYSRYIYYDADLAHEMVQEAAVEFENWALNRRLPGDVFRIDIPDGTVVTDFTRGGMTYVKGRINDPKIRRIVASARELVTNPELPSPPQGAVERLDRADQARTPDQDGWGRSTVWLWAGGLLAVAVVATLTWKVFRWMRSV